MPKKTDDMPRPSRKILLDISKVGETIALQAFHKKTTTGAATEALEAAFHSFRPAINEACFRVQRSCPNIADQEKIFVMFAQAIGSALLIGMVGVNTESAREFFKAQGAKMADRERPKKGTAKAQWNRAQTNST